MLDPSDARPRSRATRLVRWPGLPVADRATHGEAVSGPRHKLVPNENQETYYYSRTCQTNWLGFE